MEEYVDIVDESGNRTGQSKPRRDVHKSGDWHATVHVWIVNNCGDVLFQKRAAIKESFPDAWDISAAGHISAKESPLVAAVKELREELGITVCENDLQFLFTQKHSAHLNNGTFIDNEFSYVYIVKMNAGNIADLVLQESEVSEVRFLPKEELIRIVNESDPAFVPHNDEYLRLYNFLCSN